MKIILKNVIPALIILILIIVGIKSLTSNTQYDDQACTLKRMQVKGKITKVIQSHELIFYIDTINQGFPFHFNFNKDSYREFNVKSKGELYMLPKAGDSIFKEAGSKYVKFKRNSKIFIEELKLNHCD